VQNTDGAGVFKIQQTADSVKEMKTFWGNGTITRVWVCSKRRGRGGGGEWQRQ